MTCEGDSVHSKRLYRNSGRVRALNVTVPTRMARLSDAASTRHTAIHIIERRHAAGANRLTAIQVEMPIDAFTLEAPALISVGIGN